ncbi:hypothetical protein FEM48_Zijuj02G0101000 [Ziziphus jujuba var. spinosa]|uniref:Mediator of RNA polymerase II transcription subunit 28 n=1 Tax=Ziziphus jujuba var. spinosa TaxID=714518 RepID=A0A978VV46_ZIZJJ|nr:hypothetical protein FEM48_Zijuj02G0101000 [Ziziphus jujuba var. spinosa]
MAERPVHDQQHQPDPPLQSATAPKEDMMACLLALEAALLPCLPARELQAIDRSPHPSHQNFDKVSTMGTPDEWMLLDNLSTLGFIVSMTLEKGESSKALCLVILKLCSDTKIRRWCINMGSVDVERHARDFMEAAKKLQLYFISLQREDQPTKAETLVKEIAVMEEELKIKNEIINKQENLIQGWRKELKDQLYKHHTELERV